MEQISAAALTFNFPLKKHNKLFTPACAHLRLHVCFCSLSILSLVLDQLPFMMMSHPLIPASLAPASVSMAMGQMNRLSTLASMANVAQLHANHHARAPTSVIKVIFVGSFDLEGAGGGCGGAV